MALDLSALEEKPMFASALSAQSTGKPLEVPLSDIEEDPDQPRKEFSEESMVEITNSIRARGVKTPISLRPHPHKAGKWMLNHGARRYRGSLRADKENIPAFVDEEYNNYDQVIENIQRDDLKPMELALFIQKRLDAGEQKKVIAKNLGKDGAIITQHLALIDPPSCIENAYRTGKCTSPKTLYELRSLYEKYSEQVEEWCANSEEITRKTVATLADKLKGKKNQATNVSINDQLGSELSVSDVEKFGHDQISDNKDTVANRLDEECHDETNLAEVTSWPKGRAVSDPDRMIKPLMLVEYKGRSAAVLLNRRPTAAGLVCVRFEDGSGDEEVKAGACKIIQLTEA